MASVDTRLSQVVIERQGLLLDLLTLTTIFLSAVRFYAGYADLDAVFVDSLGVITPVDIDSIDKDTDITNSEWAVIKPLFLLYIEREQSTMLEASRGMGFDVYGRSSSEIDSEIKQCEDDMPKKAFSQLIVSIGV